MPLKTEGIHLNINSHANTSISGHRNIFWNGIRKAQEAVDPDFDLLSSGNRPIYMTFAFALMHLDVFQIKYSVELLKILMSRF